MTNHWIRDPAMNKTTTKIALAFAAVVALTLVAGLAYWAGSGTSTEATPSATSASASEASPEEVEEATEGEEPTEEATKKPADEKEDALREEMKEKGVTPWDELKQYDDAHALAMAIGKDYWQAGEWALAPCVKSEQTDAEERDGGGKVGAVTKIECHRDGTEEGFYLTVANEKWTLNGVQIPECDEWSEPSECFAGPGYRIESDEGHALREVMERLDIDADHYGVIPDDEWDYYDEDGECIGEAPCD